MSSFAGLAVVGVLAAFAAGCTDAASSTVPPRARAEQCEVIRGAFDIGSATTKAKVARVDVCERRLLEVLYAEDAPVGYGTDVRHAPHRIRAETQSRGIAVLRQLRTRGDVHGPDRWVGVATAAFRKADNGAEVASALREELDIDIHVVDQRLEARVGFMGAVARARVPPSQAVVWDVGGASMQISYLAGDELMTYRGQLASGQMRDHVVAAIQHKPPPASPNPMSDDEAAAARAFAEEHARRLVPEDVRARIATPPVTVIGIGAIKYYGDRPAHELGAQCSRRLLEERIESLVDKSDETIGGDYASTQVSDRLLLLGYMAALEVDTVLLADVDLTDGVMVEPAFWQRSAPANQDGYAESGRAGLSP